MNASTGAPVAPLGLDDLACPICVETIEDAFATPCGHTFCYKCISTHLKNKSNCPSCGAHLVQDNIHPNFLLRKLIKQAANNRPSLKTALLQHVQHDLAIGESNIGLQELDTAIQLLQDRRQQVATHESSNKLQLMLMFLQHAKAKQEGKLSELEQQLEVLQHDLDKAVQEQQQQQNGPAAAAGNAAAEAVADPAAARDDAAPSSIAAGVAAGAGVNRSHINPMQQQQQQQGGQQQPAIGGPSSAFQKLGSALPSQQAHQLVAGQQQAVGEQIQHLPPPAQQQHQYTMQQQQMPPPPPPQQQQPPHSGQVLQQPQQAQQQQQPAVGFRPVGFQPVGNRGFTPFTPPQQQQQQQPHPGQPPQLLATSASLLQQQQQVQVQPSKPRPQQQQQQGGFRPYGSLGGASGGFLAGLASPAVVNLQQQQPQQGFRALGGEGTAAAPLAAPAADAHTGHHSKVNPDKKRNIMQQYDELQQAHVDTRVAHVSGGASGAAAAALDAGMAQAAGGAAWQQQQLLDLGGSGPAGATAAAAAAATPAANGIALDGVSDVVAAATSQSSMNSLAYIPPSSSNGSSSNSGSHILSTIEFDCLGQMFATAGVQQRICIYDYNTITAAAADTDQQQQPEIDLAAAAAAGSSATAAVSSPFSPVLDLPTRSKISCTSFSPVTQQYLLSSDYEGLVHLWDLNGGKIVRQWQAHEKRIWAVDCCPVLQDQFATGSDDGFVKIWGLREPPAPRLTLTVRVNVCSLEYNPAVQHMLAVGSAGHQVHIFDLRNPSKPLAALKGHRKAVSYVRWAGADQLVTASTDSTLRLWSATAAAGSASKDAAAAGVGPSGSGSSSEQQQQEGGWQCTQVFRGHTNSKHFVGLSTHGQTVACGSETNEVFLYNQSLPTPTLRYKLLVSGTTRSAAAAAGSSQPLMSVGTAASSSSNGKSPFVSAVCWRKDSDVLLAANSQGGVWLLSMVSSPLASGSRDIRQ